MGEAGESHGGKSQEGKKKSRFPRFGPRLLHHCCSSMRISCFSHLPRSHSSELFHLSYLLPFPLCLQTFSCCAVPITSHCAESPHFRPAPTRHPLRPTTGHSPSRQRWYMHAPVTLRGAHFFRLGGKGTRDATQNKGPSHPDATTRAKNSQDGVDHLLSQDRVQPAGSRTHGLMASWDLHLTCRWMGPMQV